MYLDAFDGKIVDVLSGRGEPMTLAEVARATGFARSTVPMFLLLVLIRIFYGKAFL